MNAEPRVMLTFAGCATRAAALRKFAAFLDEHCAGLVRAHAAHMLAADDDCSEISSQAMQLAGELARQRAALLARFVEILDTAGDPDPPGDAKP